MRFVVSMEVAAAHLLPILLGAAWTQSQDVISSLSTRRLEAPVFNSSKNASARFCCAAYINAVFPHLFVTSTLVEEVGHG